MTGLCERANQSRRDIIRRNLLTWAALLGALAITCTLSYVPMGRGNAVLSLSIASIKTVLIVVVFMQLRRPDPLLRLCACASLLWLSFMFALTLADQQTRPAPTQPGTVTPEIMAPRAIGKRLF